METREKDCSHASVTIFFESRNSLAHTSEHHDRISEGTRFVSACGSFKTGEIDEVYLERRRVVRLTDDFTLKCKHLNARRKRRISKTRRWPNEATRATMRRKKARARQAPSEEKNRRHRCVVKLQEVVHKKSMSYTLTYTHIHTCSVHGNKKCIRGDKENRHCVPRVHSLRC